MALAGRRHHTILRSTALTTLTPTTPLPKMSPSPIAATSAPTTKTVGGWRRLSAASLLAVLLVTVLTSCVAESEAVMCYQCNSEYDPRCGDPFSEYGLGTVNCSLKDRLEHLPDVEPTLCRKTTQKIFGRIRVVRDCGYLRLPANDNGECLKRSGTFEVQTRFCSCDTDLCNAGASLHATGRQSQQLLAAAAVLLAGFWASSGGGVRNAAMMMLPTTGRV